LLDPSESDMIDGAALRIRLSCDEGVCWISKYCMAALDHCFLPWRLPTMACLMGEGHRLQGTFLADFFSSLAFSGSIDRAPGGCSKWGCFWLSCFGGLSDILLAPHIGDRRQPMGRGEGDGAFSIKETSGFGTS